MNNISESLHCRNKREAKDDDTRTSYLPRTSYAVQVCPLGTEYKQASTKMVSSRLIFFQQDYTDNALPADGRVLTRK